MNCTNMVSNIGLFQAFAAKLTAKHMDVEHIIVSDSSITFEVFNETPVKNYLFSVPEFVGAVIILNDGADSAVVNRHGAAALNNVPAGRVKLEIVQR